MADLAPAAQGWRVLETDSGHDVMVTDPKGLADLLEKAIQPAK